MLRVVGVMECAKRAREGVERMRKVIEASGLVLTW